MDSRSNKGIKTFLITSCKGGVGKSTVAANLAFSLASSGKRVLLVDCDFSNRSLDLILGYEENEDLPEDTSLRRKLKAHYLGGGYTYFCPGIICDETYFN
jgi:Mrp family chromosome partitioning ATPase